MPEIKIKQMNTPFILIHNCISKSQDTGTILSDVLLDTPYNITIKIIHDNRLLLNSISPSDKNYIHNTKDIDDIILVMLDMDTDGRSVSDNTRIYNSYRSSEIIETIIVKLVKSACNEKDINPNRVFIMIY